MRQSHDQVFVDWGMAAVNAALTAVQARHAQRVTGQAGDMSVSSARYDTTDEDGFAVVQDLGGVGIKVGEGPTIARLRVNGVAAARAVIRQLGEQVARAAA